MKLTLSNAKIQIGPTLDPYDVASRFVIKAGDTLPVLEIELLDNEGKILDLSDYSSGQLIVAPEVGGRRIIDAPVTLGIDKVTYAWQANDTAKAGNYLCEVRLTQGNDERTIPSGGYGLIVIVPRL